MAQANREASRERREQTPSRAEYLRSVEREQYLEDFNEWIAENHEGEAPEAKFMGHVPNPDGTGYVEKRKEVCEDVALKMKEQGLYVVADGVSTEAGWFAAREATMTFAEVLGEEFDRELEGLAQQLAAGKVTLDQVGSTIAGKMKGAFVLADQRVMMGTSTNEKEFGHSSGSTASVVKHVELPDGSGGYIQRAYFATIGDSPVYVQRKDGSVQKVSRDDSFAETWLKMGKITQEEFDILARAKKQSDVPPHLLERYKMRNIITKSIGVEQTAHDPNVMYIDLQPGDRIIVTSDGVDKHFNPEDLEGMTALTDTDEQLDQMILERSLESSKVNGNADDIAAVSFTAGERGPSREYLHREKGEETEQQARIEAITVHLDRASQSSLNQQHDERNKLEADWIHMKEEYQEDLDLAREQREDMVLRDRLQRELAILKKELQLDSARYSIERLQLNNTDMDLQPRFALGQEVRVMVVDQNSGAQHPHPQPWKVVNYSDKRSEYMLEGPGGQRIRQSRYRLELDQPSIQPRRGDVMSVPMDFGAGFETGFQVADIDFRTGDLLMVKEDSDGRKERRISAADAQHLYEQRLHFAQGSKERMDQFHAEWSSTRQEIKDTKARREEVMQMEARNRALMRARRGETEPLEPYQEVEARIEQLQEKASEVRAVIERFHEMNASNERRQLSGDDLREYRALKLKIMGNRNEPAYPQLLQRLEAKIQEERKKLEA